MGPVAFTDGNTPRHQSQAEARHLPDYMTNALKAVVDNSAEQVSIVQIFLFKVLPFDGASKLERALKALKNLVKEDKIQQVLEKIHKNNEILILHQTTRHVIKGDRIVKELFKLSIKPLAPSKSFGVCLDRALQIAAMPLSDEPTSCSNYKISSFQTVTLTVNVLLAL